MPVCCYISFLSFLWPNREDYGPHCYSLGNWISDVKGTKIINSKWQSHNLKPGGCNSCALLYVGVAVSNPLWKNSGICMAVVRGHAFVGGIVRNLVVLF